MNEALVEGVVQRCMAEQGFVYTPQRRSLEDSEWWLDPRLHTLSTDVVAEMGFGFTREVQAYPDPNTEVLAAMTDGEIQQWFEEVVRCKEVAHEEVNAGYKAVVLPLRADYEDLVAEFEADSITLELEGRWSECMGREGYPAGSLRGVSQPFLDEMNSLVLSNPVPDESYVERSATLRADEIRTAKAAAVCAEPIKAEYRDAWALYLEELTLPSDLPDIPQ